MKLCFTCDVFRVANEQGGACLLDPPKLFMMPIEGPSTVDRGGKLMSGSITMSPVSFYPSVRRTDGCARHLKIEDQGGVSLARQLGEH